METSSNSRRSYPIIPDRLVEARAYAALTQEELAAKIGTSDRTVRGWESGSHSPHPRYIRALSEKLDVTVPWLRGLN